MSAVAEGLIGRGTAPAEEKRAPGNWIGGPIPINNRGIRAVYFKRAIQGHGNGSHTILRLNERTGYHLRLSGATMC